MGLLVVLMLLGQVELPRNPGDSPVLGRVAPVVPKFERVMDTSDFTTNALADLVQLPAEARPFIRYLAIPPWGGEDWHKINTFVVNTAVSQSATIQLPDSAGGGWLIRWDLRRLAPKDADLSRLLVAWDSLAIDEPFFHVELSTPRTCPPYLHLDGKTYSGRRFVPAPHTEPAYSLLESETHSFAPLLRADDFLRRAVSTIDGGRYYELIGFARGGKRLTESEIFDLVGMSAATSRRVEGDDRVAMFQSGVTGKARTVEAIQGAVGQARITYDLFDRDATAGRHPIYNLLAFVEQARGKEIIVERPNGLHLFFLADGTGKLVDVAPPDLASDHNTPRPHTKQLYPPLSCIRCHADKSGVQDCPNDVTAFLGGPSGPDAYDDLSNRRASRQENVDRLAGLYAGDFTSRIRRARNDYADAVFLATRGMDVPTASHALADQYAAFWYQNIDAADAALSLGFRVADGDAADLLTAISPLPAPLLSEQGETVFGQPVTAGGDVVLDGHPVAFEDPTIFALRRGLSVRPQDWNRVFATMAIRAKKFKEN